MANRRLPWVAQAALYTLFFLGVGVVIALALELLKWVGRGL